MKTDLHIHSNLTPCVDPDMTPAAIAEQAVKMNLDVIALTDQNTVKNILTMESECQKAGIGFIPGIEVTTAEDIHFICLFPDCGKAMSFSRWMDSLLPSSQRRATQPGKPDFSLFLARNISALNLPDQVHNYHGICWPAHISKPCNSLYAVLGCWPPEQQADAVELDSEEEPKGLPESLKRIHVSNAHRLWEIGNGQELPLETADFEGLYKFLKA